MGTSKKLAARLSAIAGSEITVIERQMRGLRTDDKGNARRLAEITALARLVMRLAELEGKDGGESTSTIAPRVVDDARRLELARRLKGIRRQIEFERTAKDG